MDCFVASLLAMTGRHFDENPNDVSNIIAVATAIARRKDRCM
jgi:hypothetical protein